MPQQLQEVYTGLGQVLDNPGAFGLGEHVPHALADKLQSMRRMLHEAIGELANEQPEGDLAAELSEDFDDPSVRPES